MSECTVKMESKDDPGHTHVCVGGCETSDHKCSDPSCRRWFGLAGS